MDWFTSLETAALDNDAQEVRAILCESLDEVQFLAGPGRSEENIEVDSIFGKRFNRVRDELLYDDEHALDVVEGSVVTKSCVVEGYSFVKVESGVVLIDPNDVIVGGYISCDISLDEAHQGQGLGAELVIETFLRQGELPSWNLDTAAFSPAGYAAHVSAFQQMMKKPELLVRKMQSLEAELSSGLKALCP